MIFPFTQGNVTELMAVLLVPWEEKTLESLPPQRRTYSEELNYGVPQN